MSLVAIVHLLRRHRRRLAALVVTALVAGAVAAHHIGMDDMQMAMGDATMMVCLAVLPAVAMGAVAALRARGPRLGCSLMLPVPPGPRRLPAPVPRARAGPTATVVLRR